jgi:tripartite-type tricarboxylate transporter receptor subunit TctC
MRVVFGFFSVVAFSLVLCDDGTAQTFPIPGRQITLVVGYAPGGGHDTMARALAQELPKVLGVLVIVENRPGAGGAISVQAVARAEPNGHTLLVNSLSELSVRQTVSKVGYDLERDLAPISLVGVTPIALAVNDQMPVTTLADFAAYAKARSDGVIYGSPGVGTLMHFAGEALRFKLGVPMKHLPYNGAAPLANDLLGGHVGFAMSGLPPLMALRQSGKVRLIATSSVERSKLTPDVPSFAESGVGGVDIANYVGLAAPAKTPTAILEKLEQAALIAAKSTELQAAFARSFSSVIGSTTAEYRTFIANERTRQGELIRATSFKIAE